ncbi:hypothetical protein H2198_006623 [Neophaeococcomyces mojaviensis]|uniref:Uncharacterized protein n=1 Tax=Neophaeococcomyces mojaviensis TaxID=3383035 RepID=A0ACC3A2L8_9EURO|nr:hypothetical protein H2198_006623 [Knufia sp. JES_112]
MAPSSRNRATRSQAQTQLPAFRVTKSSKLDTQPKAPSKQKTNAIEKVIAEKARPQQPQIAPSQTTTTKNSKKRRRNSDVESTDGEAGVIQRTVKSVKKVKVLLTPPASSPEPEISQENQELPEVLQELKSLHKTFTQALSVYIAHSKGGVRDAVDLAAVLPTMTRLWKKRTATMEDVERMLAVWELVYAAQTGEIQHKRGPFKLEQNGIGLNKRVTVEYVWANATTGTFVESELQRKYEEAIEALFESQRHDGESFIWKALAEFPSLRCEVGVVTQQRKEKITSIRDSILSKAPSKLSQSSQQEQQQPQPQPDLSSLTIHSPDSPPRKSQEQTSKSRTLSLFDRVRAKQLHNSTISQPTSAELLRRRAIYRIADLVSVLRLKQARKLNSQFHDDSNSQRRMQMKVSFSFEALVQEIKDSLRSEVASEEIREGLLILGRELPGTWCSVYEVGTVRCVTLQGEGLSAREVKAWCDSRIEGTK